jgi:four helix bundle protein
LTLDNIFNILVSFFDEFIVFNLNFMHYSDLKIYGLSIKLAGEIKKLVKTIPYHWNIKEVNQIIRSSDSVHSNITEGWGRRFYRRDYIKFLNYSLTSSDETQDHLVALYGGEHIIKDDYEKYWKSYKDLSVRILNFINYQKKRFNIKI